VYTSSTNGVPGDSRGQKVENIKKYLQLNTSVLEAHSKKKKKNPRD
jgi:hypothetical protein